MVTSELGLTSLYATSREVRSGQPLPLLDQDSYNRVTARYSGGRDRSTACYPYIPRAKEHMSCLTPLSSAGAQPT